MVTDAARLSGALAQAVAARDFVAARALLHPEINFRGMTPARAWEADDPDGVERILRTWLEHPERQVEQIAPTEPVAVADTMRVGWLVRGQMGDGPFTFEQQAYVRERDERIGWLRVMCTGPRPG